MTKHEYWKTLDICDDLIQKEWNLCNRFCELNHTNKDAINERTHDAVRFETAINAFRSQFKASFKNKLKEE